MRLRTVVVALGLLVGACGGPTGTTPDVDVADAPTIAAPEAPIELHPGGWPELAALIRAANAEGRPVVVNLFASWCEPCKEEAPLLRQAAIDRPEVAFLGVNHRDLAERAEKFLDEHPLGFPTIWDFQGDVAVSIRARGMPTTAFFGRDGALVWLHTGILDRELLDKRIAEIADG